ncbi:MAG: M48 family metallopeptidase [Leptolyngbyaceae cyanobacterium]
MTLKTLLTGLQSDQFRHDLDRQATSALKQLPGLDLLLRAALGPIAEQFFYLDNISTSVLVGPTQLPELHELLSEACNVLDMAMPQLYVRQHPAPNAYTFAMRGKQPFIVVHTALLDLLNPAEIQAVLGHELGHLKCDHGVYLTLANILALAASQLPGGEIWAQGLQGQLMEWVRCAEFTCDRAALLATQDARVVASVLMKLAGGSPLLAPQLNLDAFLDQARAYEAASNTAMGEALQQLRTQNLTHPLPVLRAREIDRWSQSRQYQSLLQQKGIRYTEQMPTKGGWRNW